MPSQVPTSFASAAAAGTSQDWGARGGRVDGGGVMDWWVNGKKQSLAFIALSLTMSGFGKARPLFKQREDDEDTSVALGIQSILLNTL